MPEFGCLMFDIDSNDSTDSLESGENTKPTKEQESFARSKQMLGD